jgi:hypothetical protein
MEKRRLVGINGWRMTEMSEEGKTEGDKCTRRRAAHESFMCAVFRNATQFKKDVD